MNSAVQHFKDAMTQRNIIPPQDLIADGNIHRCDTTGKNGKGDASYLLHLDSYPAGGFENHQDGKGWENWRADTGRPLTHAEEAIQKAKTEASRRKRDADQAARRQEAQESANLLWSNAHSCAEHGYLKLKGVLAYKVNTMAANTARGFIPNLSRKLVGNLLIIPMRDTGEVLQSLQFITSEGVKRPLTGGRKQGCYHSIGRPDGVLCITEGYATGASIHQATGHAVAVAFDSGNLLPVANALRQKFPTLKLVICADDDTNTPGNPGLTKATEAAKAVGGLVALPDFGKARGERDTDFNDLHKAQGESAVARCINAAISKAAHNTTRSPKVILTPLSDVDSAPINWLWKGHLAKGKLTLIAGQPGVGKTTLALNFAATVSREGAFPDGTRCARHNVIIWSGEDDIADTLKPRLEAAGADMGRVYVLSGTTSDGKPNIFNPAKDLGLLSDAINEIGGVGMIIIDPLMSAICGDSNKVVDVRTSLQPLVDLAVTQHCTVVGITHLSKASQAKEAIERVIGSQAFVAVARIVLLAGRTSDDRCVFGVAKSNISRCEGGFFYSVEPTVVSQEIETSRIVWGEAFDDQVGSHLSTVGGVTTESPAAGAVSELRELLSDGEREYSEIQRLMRGKGYSDKQIRTARDKLGVVFRKEGRRAHSKTFWRLPDGHPNDTVFSSDAQNSSDAHSKARASLGKRASLEFEGVQFDQIANDFNDDEACL